MLEVAVTQLAADDGAIPEFAVPAGAAPERENDGQRNLALAEVVADGFAEAGAVAGIVEGVVDKLER